MTPTSVLAIAGTADSPESTVRVKRSRTPERMAWRNMLQRCYCTRDPSYPYYGGTGITVCQEWALSFTRFLQDVGRRPSALHSLDRYPDNTGNYEPGNVRWATRRQQNYNKSDNNETIGVRFDDRQRGKKWRYYFRDGEMYIAGYVATEAEAIAKRKQLEEKYVTV